MYVIILRAFCNRIQILIQGGVMAINPFKVILTSICIFQLIWMPVPVQAQEMVGANVSSVAPLISQTPFHLQGLRVYPDHQTRLQFLFAYDDVNVVDRDIQQKALKQIKFFLTALALPPEDAWVNLSPNEPDRIISDELGKTDMGKDMLAQDYVLKQITSALLSPEGETGRAFWDKIYDQLRQRGISEIPAETFHKVWIVPEKETFLLKIFLLINS
jgi:hypothetical protein